MVKGGRHKMRFPIQFNKALIEAGLDPEERKAIRNSISSNMQNYQEVQSRLGSYDVSLSKIFTSKTNAAAILKVNYELQFYNEHGYTEFESKVYNGIIDDLVVIGIYNVEPETLDKISQNECDWTTLQYNLSQALFYNELYQESGDMKFLEIVNGCRENITNILSKYV